MPNSVKIILFDLVSIYTSNFFFANKRIHGIDMNMQKQKHDTGL